MKRQPTVRTYKFRANAYKALGMSTIGLTTIGGFFAYQAISNFAEFKAELEAQEFLVVNPETAKLNPWFAFPLLIGLIVFMFVSMKKNKEFFKGKTSIGLIITIAVIYFIYSIALMTLASLLGALGGSLLDEMVFTPLSVANKIEAGDQKELDLEEAKERRRIKARRKAREELSDGSV